MVVSSRSVDSSGKKVLNTNFHDDSMSGRSADKESSASVGLPPVVIVLHTKQNRKLSDQGWRSKRRKGSERNDYAGANATADLARAGRPYPSGMTLPLGIIPTHDISKVQLVSSQSVQSLPFLRSGSCGWPSVNFGAAFQNPLNQQTSAVPPHRSRNSTDRDDTTSTFSDGDTESDGSHVSSYPRILAANVKLDENMKQESRSAEYDPEGYAREVNNVAHFAVDLTDTTDSSRIEIDESRLICQEALYAQVVG